eukprot:PITA_01851
MQFQGKCCKVIIDSGNTDNLVSVEMVEKFALKRMTPPTPYWVTWMKKGHHILFNEQSNMEFQIGSYKDEVLCDIMPMDVFHVLLRRLWQYDKGDIHNGRKNTYSFNKDNYRNMLLPLEEKGSKEDASPNTLISPGKRCYNKSSEMRRLPNDFPPVRSISHHIDLILGASLPNKETYRMTPRENEEIKKKFQVTVDKVLIR